mmetsp:Transcript_27228/g.65181  ORF Transcript_27228/g.65181 Transcript_27228/m.65181 type:complete len:219 (-) Transcript_27228:7-663(-)
MNLVNSVKSQLRKRDKSVSAAVVDSPVSVSWACSSSTNCGGNSQIPSGQIAGHMLLAAFNKSTSSLAICSFCRITLSKMVVASSANPSTISMLDRACPNDDLRAAVPSTDITMALTMIERHANTTTARITFNLHSNLRYLPNQSSQTLSSSSSSSNDDKLLSASKSSSSSVEVRNVRSGWFFPPPPSPPPSTQQLFVLSTYCCCCCCCSLGVKINTKR